MNTLGLLGQELRNWYRKPFLWLVAGGVALIPLLYSVLYLWAFWDPYSLIDHLPAAVVVEDKGGVKDGEPQNVGQEFAERLRTNTAVEWHITDRAEAEAGLAEGQYFFVLYVPPEFTEQVLTASAANPQQAMLTFEQNPSTNFLATSVAQRIVLEVKTELAQSVSSGYFTASLSGLQEAADGLHQAADGATQLADGTKEAQTGAAKLQDGADQLKDGAQSLAAGTTSAKAGAQQVASGATTANAGAAKLAVGAQAAKAGAAQVAMGAAGLQQGTAQVQQGAADLKDGAADLTEGLTALQAGTQQTAQAVAGAKQILAGIAQVNPALAADPSFQQALALVSGAEGGLNGQILPGMSQAVAGGQRLTEGAGDLQQGATQVVTGATQLAGGATALQSGVGDLSDGLTQLSSGLATLNGGSSKLAAGVTELDGGAQRLASGLSDLAAGSADLTGGLTQLEDGSATLATKLSDAAATIADAAQGDPTSKGEVLANPVGMNQVSLHEVKAYGTGLAPYFTPLGLWVGAMVLFFVIRAKEPRTILSGIPAPVAALAKYLFFASLAVVQAVLASFVLIHFLGLQVQSVAQFYGLNILLSLVFVAIFQLLVTAFGLIGRFLGIVILMLQLTSAGGTFPTQMLPGFFQALHPYMPMTYAVEALRTIISGSASIGLADSVLRLVAFGVVSLVGAMLLTPRFVTLKDLRPSRDLAM